MIFLKVLYLLGVKIKYKFKIGIIKFWELVELWEKLVYRFIINIWKSIFTQSKQLNYLKVNNNDIKKVINFI